MFCVELCNYIIEINILIYLSYNLFCRNKPELENPYVFSNIEVENAVMEVQEPRDIPLRQMENVSAVGIREQDSGIPPTNQSNNNNGIGSGIITVST